MKAILINPHMPSSSWFNSEVAGISPPLGLVSIASYFNNMGNQAIIVDNSSEMLNDTEIVEKVKHYKPDIIGITSTTTNFNISKRLISLIKKETGIPIAIGGHHTSALPEYVLNTTNVDFVVIGEGEKTFFELSEKLKNGGTFSDIKGLGYRENGKIKISCEVEHFEDIKDLFLDYSLLPLDKYRPSLSRRLSSGYFSTIITSRGCPYKCKFCSKLIGEKHILRNPEIVIKEIEFLKKNYDISELIIWDDTFTFEKERAIYIAKAIKKITQAVWSCYSRVDTAEDGLYYEFKKNGLRELVFGAESANNDMLNKINKKITKEQTELAINISQKHKISTFLSVILGLPHDTRETIEETIDYFISIDPDYLAFTTLIPFPGSDYFDMALEKGLINIETTDWDSYVTIFSTKPPPCSFCELSSNELVKIQKYAMRKFLFRKKYIQKNIIKILDEGLFRASALFKGFKTVIKHQIHKI